MFRKSNELNILYGGRRLSTVPVDSDSPDTPTSGEPLPKNAVFTDVLVGVREDETEEIRIHLYNEDADIWVLEVDTITIDRFGARINVETRGYDRICVQRNLEASSFEAYLCFPRLEG